MPREPASACAHGAHVAHFPPPGTAFASQARRGPARASGAEGAGSGRVVLTFGEESVGVLVTSSMPGWSAASAAAYAVVCGRHLADECGGGCAATTSHGHASSANLGGDGDGDGDGDGGGGGGGNGGDGGGGAAAAGGDGGSDGDGDGAAAAAPPPPLPPPEVAGARSRGGSPDALASAGRRSPAEVAADEDAEAPADALYHVRIRSINFSRTVDFVSLGERGLVEFVQLNALMEPQLIWYRPLLKSSHPWQ